MANQSTTPGCLTILLHVFLVFITGGFWLLVLAVWGLLTYLNKNKS